MNYEFVRKLLKNVSIVTDCNCVYVL